MSTDAAVDLLFRHLGALPDPDFGVINMLPWAQESKETNAIKRKVCQAIVRVFTNGGYPMDLEVQADREPPRIASLRCSSCDTHLFDAAIDKSGKGGVPAQMLIGTLAGMDPQCPHNTFTLDDHRRKLEEVLREQ